MPLIAYKDLRINETKRDLIEKHVMELTDEDLWNEKLDLQIKHRRELQAVADNWDEVVASLDGEINGDDDEEEGE